MEITKWLTSSSKFVLSNFKVEACTLLRTASNTSHVLFSSLTPVKSIVSIGMFKSYTP